MAKAKTGDTVKVHYTGKLSNGDTFDTTKERNPMQLKIGQKDFIEAFEQALIGMTPGETKTINIPSDKAFGKYQEELVREIDRGSLPEDMQPEVGQRVTATRADGKSVAVTITDVSEDNIKIDANHPLAGEDLTLDVELLDILKAT